MERKWPFVSHCEYIQTAYETMRENGQSHNMAEVCAFRKPPGSETDTQFVAGKPETFGFNMDSPPDKRIFNKYKAMAKKVGVSTAGKHYQHGLASYPGDPAAWVESKDDAKKIAEKRGLAVRLGTLEVDHRGGKTHAEDSKPAIDPNLVKFWTDQKILKDNEGQGRIRVSKAEYKHKFEDTHTTLSEGYN